jgi:hypothetical protein
MAQPVMSNNRLAATAASRLSNTYTTKKEKLIPKGALGDLRAALDGESRP